MHARRIVGAAARTVAVAGVALGCHVHQDLTGCDAVVTHCNTYCSTVCDFWGCYPSCYDDCYDECIVVPPPANPVAPGNGGAPPVADAAAPPDADAAAPSGSANDGGAALCAPCFVNDDCNAGALCLVAGGDAAVDAAAPGFCGAPCMTEGDPTSCQQGFSCVSIGSSLQCVPTSGGCP